MFRLILFYLTISCIFCQYNSIFRVQNANPVTCCDLDEIEVSGEGSVFGQPDIAIIRVSF